MAKGKVRANLTARKRSASSLEPDDDASDSHESGKKRVRWDGEVPEDVQTQQNEEEEESECVPNKVGDTIVGGLFSYSHLTGLSRRNMPIVRLPHILILCWLNRLSGRIGAAYYDPITSKVYVLEDSQENAQYDLTRTGTSLLTIKLLARIDCASNRASSSRCCIGELQSRRRLYRRFEESQ